MKGTKFKKVIYFFVLMLAGQTQFAWSQVKDSLDIKIGQMILIGFAGREVDAKVLEEINLLPTKAGLVLKLYALEGWSHSEIAEELEISVGTSKSQLNYARSVLKQKLVS